MQYTQNKLQKADVCIQEVQISLKKKTKIWFLSGEDTIENFPSHLVMKFPNY